jgi:methionyl-tRNA formyltransferase
VTIIRLVQEMDAGPILGQTRMNLTGRERCGDLEQALSEMGASLLLACIDRISQGHAIWRNQEAGQVTWAPKLTSEMTEMDWTRDAFFLDRHVRALSPSPGARTQCQGGSLKVIDSLPSPDPAASAPPGTLLRVESPGIWVSAGQGQLCLVRVQPAGGKVMDALAFARGRALEAGHRLGPTVPEVP